MLNDAPSIIVHLPDSVKCTHKREIIKKNALTVTHNVQSNGDGPDYDGDGSGNLWDDAN